MLVSDAMTKDVGSLVKDATLDEAAEMMREYQIGSIIAVRESENGLVPVGILTDRDIVVEVLAENVEGKRLTIEDVMSRDIITVARNASLFTAVKIMERNGIRRLPVVDERGGLCGIITADDIAGHLALAIHSLSKVPGIQRTLERQVRQWALK